MTLQIPKNGQDLAGKGLGGATCKSAAHTKISVGDLYGRVSAYFFCATRNFDEISMASATHTIFLAVDLSQSIWGLDRRKRAKKVQNARKSGQKHTLKRTFLRPSGSQTVPL